MSATYFANVPEVESLSQFAMLSIHIVLERKNTFEIANASNAGAEPVVMTTLGFVVITMRANWKAALMLAAFLKRLKS
jgi:hypothetical protein